MPQLANPTFCQSKDIYDLYPPCRRRCLLALAASVYTILPLSDTIILPQLSAIEQELGASQALVTASMSLYLFTIGLGFLFWGPAADWLGRAPVYHISIVSVAGTSIGAAVAPNIMVLLACRALQGLPAAGTFAAGNATVADVYPPAHRGIAWGVFTMPGMLCPIIAPFIVAALSASLGWRSTMSAIAILAGAIELAVAVVYRETHPTLVIRHLQRQALHAGLPPPPWAQSNTLGAARPSRGYQAPWSVARRFLGDRGLLPHWLVSLLSFCCVFVLLIQLPRRLAAHGLSQMQVGLVYLCTGGASMVGSLVGGWAADRLAVRVKGGRPVTARLELVGPAGMVLAPLGMLLFGWTGGVRGGAAVAAALLGGSILCWASSFLNPAVFSFTSIRAEEQAGAAGALLAALMNMLAAPLVQLSVTAVEGIGVGAYDSILAAVLGLAAAVSFGLYLWERLKSRVDAASVLLQAQGKTEPPLPVSQAPGT